MLIYILFCLVCAAILTVEFRKFSEGRIKHMEIAFIAIASFLPIVNLGAAIVALGNLYNAIDEEAESCKP